MLGGTLSRNPLLFSHPLSPSCSEVVLRTLTVPEDMSGLAVSAWPQIHETLVLMRRNVLLLRDPEDPQKLYPVRRVLVEWGSGLGRLAGPAFPAVALALTAVRCRCACRVTRTHRSPTAPNLCAAL